MNFRKRLQRIGFTMQSFYRSITCLGLFLLFVGVMTVGCASGPRGTAVASAEHRPVTGRHDAAATQDDEDLEARYRMLLREIRGEQAVERAPAQAVVKSSSVAEVPQPAQAVREVRRRNSPVANSSRVTVQPEAVLRIRVEEDPSLDGQYLVNEIGAVNLGYIGPIILYNRTEEQATEKIREVLMSRSFRNATVECEILRASYDRVRIDGQVNNPGSIRIGAGDSISLNDALLRAGGLRGTVQGMQVRLIRGGMTNVLASAQEGEVYAMQRGNGRPVVPDVWLQNNDKVIVFSSQAQAAAEYGEKEIIMLGEVHRPGPVRFSPGEPATIMHLAFKTGGFPRYANQRAVRIVRRDEAGRERKFTVNVEQIMETGNPDNDVALEHGDRIIVPARRLSLF